MFNVHFKLFLCVLFCGGLHLRIWALSTHCTDATGPRQWCYWAPAEMGRVPETWGTNGQSGNLGPLHTNSVKGQVQNSTHEENFLLKIQKGANWLLKVATLIRLFNQGSYLEQSFQSSPPVLGLWVGLSGLGPWLGLCGLGPWSLTLTLTTCLHHLLHTVEAAGSPHTEVWAVTQTCTDTPFCFTTKV